jgi:hypothetical protein
MKRVRHIISNRMHPLKYDKSFIENEVQSITGIIMFEILLKLNEIYT